MRPRSVREILGDLQAIGLLLIFVPPIGILVALLWLRGRHWERR